MQFNFHQDYFFKRNLQTNVKMWRIVFKIGKMKEREKLQFRNFPISRDVGGEMNELNIS